MLFRNTLVGEKELIHILTNDYNLPNTLDFDAYIALSLVSNDYLRYFIEKKYTELDKTTDHFESFFIEAAKNEHLASIERNISARYANYLRQTYIWVKCNGGKQDTFGAIEELIKKGYKELYIGYIHHKDAEDYARKLVGKITGLDMNNQEAVLSSLFGQNDFKIKKSSIELINEYTVLLFLSAKKEQSLHPLLHHIYSSSFLDFHLAIYKAIEEHKEEIRSKKKALAKESVQFWIDYFQLKNMKPSEEIYFEDLLEYLKVDARKKHMDFLSDDTELVNNTDNLRKYVGFLSRFIYLSRGKQVIDYIKFTKKELEDIIKLGVVLEDDLKDKKNLEVRELNMFTTFFFVAILREYDITRESYTKLVGNDELFTILDEFKKVKNQLAQTEIVLQDSKADYATIKLKLKNAETQLAAKEKEMRIIEAELKKQRESERELLSLRDMMYHIAKEETPFEEDAVAAAIASLHAHSIIIIGGHITWQKKVKEVLPHATLIDITKKNVNLSFISSQKAMVVFNTATNSHSFYERFMNEMRKNDNPLYFFHENGSIDKFILWLSSKI